MEKKFLVKQGASNYYLVNSGMGGFLCPLGHPEHNWCIEEYRGGRCMEMYSLSSAKGAEYLPPRVRWNSAFLLARWKARHSQDIPDSAWLDQVYTHFNHRYSPDGVNRNAGDCILDYKNEQPPEYHLAYLFVKQFYPDHVPDMVRIKGK
ncbi:MAG: hypothetical protein A2W22_03165 [Candidatus Levybacteria bacterium RBG_16_35_11]|nr:MAG: hypothetical protein A2W22_03165 [Candidatus Levybacteria bacterium RBG_16_35_11]